MTPTELLAAAQRLLDRPDARTAPIWPRAAALLARQALEQGLDHFWRAKGLKLDTLATKPQLICLQAYLPDRELAARTNDAWSNLTRACHHHPYELGVGQEELKTWLETVAQVLVSAETNDAPRPEAV
jgi:hypothetical protein